MKKNKRIKNVILIFAITFVAVSIFGNIIATLLYSSIISKTLKFSVAFMIKPFSLIVGVVLGIGFVIFLAVYFAKFKFYTDPKQINDASRADSHLFGTDRLQTKEELMQNYGYYNFEELSDKEVHGILVNSELVHTKKDSTPKLMVSLIPKTNALLIGAPGTGKSTLQLGITIQANAKSKTKASMVILDPKGVVYNENKKALLKEGYAINLIDLNNPREGSQYNPMHLIYKYYHEYQSTLDGTYLDLTSLLINELALTLVPSTSSTDPMWQQGAQGVISGIIWAMLEDSLVEDLDMTEEKFNLTQISNIANKQKDELSNYLTNRDRTSPASEQAAAIIGNSSERTVDGYMSSIGASLRNFLDEGMKYLTANHDIDMEMIKQPTATFIIIPDAQSSRDVMGTLIISQIYRSLIMRSSKYPNQTLPRTVYFLIDEFGNLPQIPDFLKWISLCRSRNIFFELIVQSLGQLTRIYGDTGQTEIMSNCPLHMFLGTNDEPTIEEFSKKFGTYTAYQHSRNVDIDKVGDQLHGQTSLVQVDVVKKEDLRNNKFGNMYFKFMSSYGCKSKLCPIFDKKLSNIIIYKDNVPPHFDMSNVVETVITEKAIDFDANFYDIKKRNKIIDAKPKNKKATDSFNNFELFPNDEFDYSGIDNTDLIESLEKNAQDAIANELSPQLDFIDLINR